MKKRTLPWVIRMVVFLSSLLLFCFGLTGQSSDASLLKKESVDRFSGLENAKQDSTARSISTEAENAQIDADSIKPWIISVNPYGSLRGQFAYFQDELEVQDNGSRIGFKFSSDHGNFQIFAGAELSVVLLRGGARFNTEAVTQGGFLTLNREQSEQVFATRLGYLGIDIGKGGSISIGKQWGVYYDITGYTDKFNVFGGQASATYVADTDGGTLGTGRADQAVLYRNSLGPVEVGAQLQFRSVLNGNLVDGVGASLQLNLIEGLKIGGAYNRSFFDNNLIERAAGMETNPEYWAIGANYKHNGWDVGLVYANETNGDLVQVFVPSEGEVVGVVFDAVGIEFFAKRRFGKWAVLTGVNNYDPENNDDLPYNRDFRRRVFILGAEFHPLESALIYTEYRFSDSIGPNGIRGFDVFTLGLRYDFNWYKEKAFKPKR